MYEHPIKQAGLSMNRILFSNTMMVMGGFPNAKAQQFQLSFKYRTFENGKSTSTQCKFKSISSIVDTSNFFVSTL